MGTCKLSRARTRRQIKLLEAGSPRLRRVSNRLEPVRTAIVRIIGIIIILDKLKIGEFKFKKKSPARSCRRASSAVVRYATAACGGFAGGENMRRRRAAGRHGGTTGPAAGPHIKLSKYCILVKLL